MHIPTFDDVEVAHKRIGQWTHRSPVLANSHLNELTGANLLFKCENFQKAGAFKARGACNAVFGLDDEAASRGVTTHSSGNHASALAYAAARRGIRASVVMPTNASATKKAAVLTYGGQIIDCEPSASAREAAVAELVANTGAAFVHPYNDHRVIAGQATCAKELLEEVDGLDALIAPIGGGGLVSGSCLTRSVRSPKTKVYAAEPEKADDAYLSMKAGKIISHDAPDTVADGLKVPLKDLTWHFVSRYVEDILLVSEREIIDAMRLVWQRMKIVVEPSSAVAVAAVCKSKEVFAGKTVGVILTGGNVDLDALPWSSS